ncbi:hypothetical protein WDZ92_08675 [Nostoc sp. NIES-2111]
MDARAIKQQAIELNINIEGYDMRKKADREVLITLIETKKAYKQLQQEQNPIDEELTRVKAEFEPTETLESVRAEVLAMGVPESFVVNEGSKGSLEVWKLAKAIFSSEPQKCCSCGQFTPCDDTCNVHMGEQDINDEIRYQQEERKAIQTEHLQPENSTDFYEYIEELVKADGGNGETDSDNDDQSTTEILGEQESKISFSRVSVKGFFSPNVAMIGIGDETRYIQVIWQDENTAISKNREVSVSYGNNLSICELQISIDDDGLYSAYPLSRHGGKVQFLAPNENTRYAEITALILPNGKTSTIEVDHKAQTATGVFSRDKVLCRIVRNGKKLLRYPLSGWFENVGSKWYFSGDSMGIEWLGDVQEQIKDGFAVGGKCRHQDNFGCIWEILDLNYSGLVLNARCICLKGNDIHKEQEIQVFPVVQLIPANNDSLDRPKGSYIASQSNENYNNLLDTVALKKAYAIAQARDKEDSNTSDIQEYFKVEPTAFDDRF